MTFAACYQVDRPLPAQSGWRAIVKNVLAAVCDFQRKQVSALGLPCFEECRQIIHALPRNHFFSGSSNLCYFSMRWVWTASLQHQARQPTGIGQAESRPHIERVFPVGANQINRKPSLPFDDLLVR